MREKEIREELELCARGFLEAKERSEKKGIDDFDELRILEAAFNRLFVSLEHLCNAVILTETGNFSKKHFGDIQKLKSLKEKYKTDFASFYQAAYNFRSYADYRKCPQVKDVFNRQELKNNIKTLDEAIKNSLEILGGFLDIKDIKKRLYPQEDENRN